MKEYIRNKITIETRCFGVTVDDANGATLYRYIVLSKEQLQAAQLVGESSKELIHRICNRNGYVVVDIDKPERKTITVEMDALWECH